jgi:hypothetical protein
LKRYIAKEAIDRSASIEELCVELLAAGLGLKIERESAAA